MDCAYGDILQTLQSRAQSPTGFCRLVGINYAAPTPAMAPRVGLGPTTLRLTAACSTC